MSTPISEQQSSINSRSRVAAVIPARGGSKRLPRKNIYPFLGKPMISYAIKACKGSKYIDRVFVSTEDKEIKKVAKKLGAEIIDRPEYLSEDYVWTQEVLKHAVLDMLGKDIRFDLVARIQAACPMITSEKIDEAIVKLLKNNLWEVSSVDQNGVEDNALHILRKNVVFQNALSVYNGVVITDYMDIHTKEDVKAAEKAWKEKSIQK